MGQQTNSEALFRQCGKERVNEWEMKRLIWYKDWFYRQRETAGNGSTFSLAILGQSAGEVGSGWTGLELLTLGREKDALARGASLGGSLIEGLAGLVRRRVQVQGQGTGRLEWVGHTVEAELVRHVGGFVAVQDRLSLDGHGTGLLALVITVVRAQARVWVVGLGDDLVGPLVQGLFELAVQHLHDAVGTRVIMNGTTGSKKRWIR